MHSLAVWLPIGVLAVGFDVFCFLELIRRPVKTLPKAVWALIILVQVPLGGICYLMLGRAEPPSRTLAGTVPDLDETPLQLPAPHRPRDAVRPTAMHADRPAVQTTSVTRVYPGDVGLHAIDLAVPANSVYGLVGPNGAGKTTLLSILAGVRRADSGTVEFAAPSTRVMLCPDAPAFEPWLTAAETVDLFRGLGTSQAGASQTGASQTGASHAGDIGLATDQALERAGLTEARDRRVGGFSRGMTQRLGLAVALASNADVLLLDEPTSALDPQGRAEVLDLITELARNRAVVFSSHILADVQRVADNVGILRRGRLIYQGPIRDLLEHNLRPSWLVHLRSGAHDLVNRLRSHDWVAAVEEREQGLRVDTISLSAGETLLPAEIAASGAELIAFNPIGADLEAVFFSLLGKDTDAGSAVAGTGAGQRTGAGQ